MSQKLFLVNIRDLRDRSKTSVCTRHRAGDGYNSLPSHYPLLPGTSRPRSLDRGSERERISRSYRQRAWRDLVRVRVGVRVGVRVRVEVGVRVGVRVRAGARVGVRVRVGVWGRGRGATIGSSVHQLVLRLAPLAAVVRGVVRGCTMCSPKSPRACTMRASSSSSSSRGHTATPERLRPAAAAKERACSSSLPCSSSNAPSAASLAASASSEIVKLAAPSAGWLPRWGRSGSAKQTSSSSAGGASILSAGLLGERRTG
eukprot:scaffold6957_cov65-Phaeocystis_antarctica.AAC.1